MTQRSGIHCLSPKLIVLVLVLMPLLAVVRPQPAAAAGVVSTCTETALRNALAGGGLVTFSCSGAIPIASQIEIETDTIIDGGGQVTLDGQGITQLILVNRDVALELRGLTLTGGEAFSGQGGALRNDRGTVTITDSTLSGNNGAFGGAIFSFQGRLTISASTLSNNSGEHGGAIDFSGGINTIASSTLLDNSATTGAGAISSSGNLLVIASTLTGNSSGNFGGAIANVGPGNLDVVFSTFAENESGAIETSDFPPPFPSATTTVTASFISGESADNCDGPMASGGYNVSSDASCNLTATGDVQNANPLLGNLANNGGPTLTMLPLIGSPAIDRVPNALCATLNAANDGHDQRGTPRPEGALPCDSGSVELQVNSYFCVGERSGSLRYFVTPDGCVRGEYRLLPVAGGNYDFCVGERSGSMRYLMAAGANCLRGEWKLALPQPDPITICVGERSRSVRYLTEPGQCSPRGELAYVIINPVA